MVSFYFSSLPKIPSHYPLITNFRQIISLSTFAFFPSTTFHFLQRPQSLLSAKSKKDRSEQELCFKLSALLAALAHNRCTSLVCSCYVPSRSNKGKEEEEEETNDRSINTKCSSPTPSPTSTSNKDHHRHHHGAISEDEQVYINDHVAKINGDRSGARNNMNGGIEMLPTPTPLKSNLKKSTIVHEEANQLITGIRKVSWPDAYGKDIAHIQEFEPSVSDDGELEGVRNSCVCVIL